MLLQSCASTQKIQVVNDYCVYAKLITIKEEEFVVLIDNKKELRALLIQILDHDKNYKKYCEKK
jgi:hypothetical protein